MGFCCSRTNLSRMRSKQFVVSFDEILVQCVYLSPNLTCQIVKENKICSWVITEMNTDLFVIDKHKNFGFTLLSLLDIN